MASSEFVAVGEIQRDSPLRLSVAAQLGFPDGSMTANGLRREIEKGNLAHERVAGKIYTTLGDIVDMRMKCRENQKEPDSTGVNPARVVRVNGSSSTEQLSVARDAAKMVAQRLRSPSKRI